MPFDDRTFPSGEAAAFRRNRRQVSLWLFVFAFLRTPSPRPSARWSDTGPRFGSEIKNRASVSLCPFATVTVLAFAGLLNALPRAARCLPKP